MPRGRSIVEELQREIRRRLPGVRFLLAKTAQMIVNTSVYLADAIHSQSFSLSQRFNPTRALWSYFVPHPPIGFRPPEFSPLNQQLRLSVPDTLMPLSTRSVNSRETRSFTGAPAFNHSLLTIQRIKPCSCFPCTTSKTPLHISCHQYEQPRLSAK
jgi:predicted DNA-binding helix-hairpin-helix protein